VYNLFPVVTLLHSVKRSCFHVIHFALRIYKHSLDDHPHPPLHVHLISAIAFATGRGPRRARDLGLRGHHEAWKGSGELEKGSGTRAETTALVEHQGRMAPSVMEFLLCSFLSQSSAEMVTY
jgi:hypothetical protein